MKLCFSLLGVGTFSYYNHWQLYFFKLSLINPKYLFHKIQPDNFLLSFSCIVLHYVVISCCVVLCCAFVVAHTEELTCS
jgi:hypothetical protein